MMLDEGYYRGLFLREGRDVHEDVVDYLMPFLRRRKGVFRGMTVDQICQHCEHIIHKPVPMDIFIGALLYARYYVEEINGQFYACISQRSPLIAIQNGRGGEHHVGTVHPLVVRRRSAGALAARSGKGVMNRETLPVPDRPLLEVGAL